MCRGFGRWLNDCNFSNDIGCRWWQLTYHVLYTWQRHIIINNSNIVTFSSGNWGNVCLCTSLSKNKRCRCTQTTNPCTEKQSWNPVLFVFDPGGHVHFSYQNLSHSFSYFSWWGMGVTTGRDVLATTPVGVILSPRRHEFDLTIEVWRDPVEFFRIKMILWGFHWIWMDLDDYVDVDALILDTFYETLYIFLPKFEISSNQMKHYAAGSRETYILKWNWKIDKCVTDAAFLGFEKWL